ncbi:lysophospholipid acyltransferase family protein [Pseudonocardia sp. CA-107938]|uniref:lysophospholipid acyltransferase family protein n=1 Tax=Pseudonocardia sp. CA-107938 TaxID=3240021 RepID=UPI003D911785
MTDHAVGLTGWAPTSPCTPDCLPARTGSGGGWRLAAMAALLAVTAGAAFVLPRRPREWVLVRGARLLLALAGVRLVVHGEQYAPRGQGVLVVANHLSWIDVVALGAVSPVRLLAKREVRGWPVIGGLAARTGALFVDRAGLRALPVTVAETAAALRAGATVGVFPEGTTWCGAAAGTFRRAPFQAAIDAAVPVRPVAIALRTGDGAHVPDATFVGDQTLLDSMRRVVELRGLVCELTLLPLIPVDVDGSRRALAARAAEAVGAATGVPHGVVPARVPAAA